MCNKIYDVKVICSEIYTDQGFKVPMVLFFDCVFAFFTIVSESC